ncbi:MAG TPA: hypothetical protein VKP65_08910, partial [Rhodothermales bacterium]|nr:hypothetical protein [Rhodothermales bacterium]
TAHRAGQSLRANGVASDGTGSGRPSAQSIWAVQQVLVDIQVGPDDQSGPFYLSPKPLDNTLNTAVVPLPKLPDGLEPVLPSEQLFTDIDLDVLNREFFKAVDNFLSPASASKTFEVARTAYTETARGRKSIADQYAEQEVDWLFDAESPFTGTTEQLDEAREAFAQQMRAALMTAYAVDTVVQYTVSWKLSLPSEVGDDNYALYGQVQPAGGKEPPKGYSFSTAKVPIMEDGAGLFTFLFGLPNVKDTNSVTLDLEYNVTHLEYFLEPANQVPEGKARPSLWLQLINPYTDNPPHVGPSGEETTIPLVLRQYPTPPTVISQQGVQGAESEAALEVGSNPLTTAAAWHLLYRYQAQLTVHDQLISAVTYNTDLSASSGGSSAQAALLDDDPVFTLFEALARFFATYPVLLPVLNNLADPNWDKAADVFASLVNGVVNNSTWNPVDAALASRALARITDRYTITDRVQDTARLITLLWASQESSFPEVKLTIQAIGPDGQPYPNQVPGTVTNGITDQYTPDPPLVEDWVTHEVEVQNLNVLMAENALSGVQVERNLIEMEGPGGTTWTAQQEFVYKTPLVRATEPVTPFVDNKEAINVADLPNQGIGQGCPQAPPAGLPSLCQRIYTMMYDLLADDDMIAGLTQARLSAGQDESVPRRVKVACSFQYPVSVAGGVTSSNPVAPLFPVVLARSFLIDAAQQDQLSEFSSMYATAVAQWAEENEVAFGTDAQQEARFVFDITLYAQLSGLNTPVLRLRNLQLNLTDIVTS